MFPIFNCSDSRQLALRRELGRPEAIFLAGGWETLTHRPQCLAWWQWTIFQRASHAPRPKPTFLAYDRVTVINFCLLAGWRLQILAERS